MKLPKGLEKWRGMDWVPVNEGESGARVWRADGVFLKHGRGIAAEREKLEWFGKYVAVPRVEGYCEEGDEAWLVTRALPGVSAEVALEEGRMEVVGALGRFLRRLHEVPVEECPFGAEFGVRMEEARRNLEAGRVDEDDFDEAREGWTAEQVWARMEELLPVPEERVVTHGDYSLGNVIVEGGEVTGVIDVGRAGVAHPYQDVAIAWENLAEFGEEWQREFLRGYGLGEVDARLVELHLCLDEFF